MVHLNKKRETGQVFQKTLFVSVNCRLNLLGKYWGGTFNQFSVIIDIQKAIWFKNIQFSDVYPTPSLKKKTRLNISDASKNKLI